jgi:hypothetical protein
VVIQGRGTVDVRNISGEVRNTREIPANTTSAEYYTIEQPAGFRDKPEKYRRDKVKNRAWMYYN